MVSTHLGRLIQFCAALALMLCQVTVAAEIQVWLDPESIEEGDSAELNIRVNDVQSAPEIDLSSIGSDVEIVSNITNSQLRSINGRVETWTTRTLTLRPLRTGAISIGPISMGNEVTKPLILNVAPLSSAVRAAIDETLFFETALLEDSVYVQSQATYVRKLYYAEGAQLYGDLPGAPNVEQALVVALPEVSPYRENRNSRSYGVLEQRYAVFPEKPGQLTIEGASVTGSIVLRERGRSRRRGIVVTAEEVSIPIKGVPAGYPDDEPWFPARSVRLEQRWDADVDSMMVGTPVTRSLVVSAENATASLIPPVSASLGDLRARAYDEAPTLTESAAGTDVIGAREQRTSIVPTASGTNILPAVEVTWFDTEAEQVKVARLAAQTLLIVPDPTAPEEVENKAVAPMQSPQLTASRNTIDGRVPWMLATLLACVGWLLTSLYLLRTRPAHDSIEDRSITDASSPARASNNQPNTAKTLHKRLRAAARSGDLQALRRLLDQWLIGFFDESLPDATLCWRAQPHAATALDRLDAALYARADDNRTDDSAKVAQAVLAAVEATSARGPVSATDSTDLPGLYDRPPGIRQDR